MNRFLAWIVIAGCGAALALFVAHLMTSRDVMLSGCMLVVFIVSAVVMIHTTVTALASGVIKARFGVCFLRSTSPIGYWFYVCMYSAIALFGIAWAAVVARDIWS